MFLQRKVHLGCNSLYVQQCAGHPQRHGDNPRQVMVELSEHSEMQSYGLEALQSPAFCRLWVHLPPDCPGCWGHLCFRESSVISWKLLTGMGLEGRAQQVSSSVAFHWRTESALGTFTQPHSISREVGAGLSPQWDRDKDRRQAQGHLLGEPAPDSLVLLVLLGMSGAQLDHMPIVCFWGQGRARVLWREEVLALGSAIALGVRIWSVWLVPTTTGALWLVGRRELWGWGAGGWHRNPLPAQAGAGLARAQPAQPERETTSFPLVLGLFLPVRAGLRFPSQFPLSWQGQEGCSFSQGPASSSPSSLVAGRAMKKQPAGQGQAGSGHEMVLLIWTLSSSVHCLGSSAEHGASTGWGSGGDAQQGWLGSVRAPLSSGSPLQAKEKLGLMSTTAFSHQPGEEVPGALPPAHSPRSPAQPQWTDPRWASSSSRVRRRWDLAWDGRAPAAFGKGLVQGSGLGRGWWQLLVARQGVQAWRRQRQR